MRDVNFGDTTGNTNVVDKSKKTISISIGSVVILFVIIAFFWYGSNQIEKKILGTWHNDEISDLYLVFSEDNSLTVNRSNMTIEGTYIFVDENRIQLNFNASIFNYVINADVSVQGNTLSFDNIDDLSEYFFLSDQTTFQKVK